MKVVDVNLLALIRGPSLIRVNGCDCTKQYAACCGWCRIFDRGRKSYEQNGVVFSCEICVVVRRSQPGQADADVRSRVNSKCKLSNENLLSRLGI